MVSRRDFNFFRENAGGIVGQTALNALHLARALATVESRDDLRIVWESDPDGAHDHKDWCDDFAKKKRCDGHTIQSCSVIKGKREYLASLCGIIDASMAYERVVAAELSCEALAVEAKQEAKLIKEIASELTAVNDFATECDGGSCGPDEHMCGEGGIDVRLQLYTDGHWAIRFGDASYDTHHQGYWGASSVPGNGWTFDAEETARDLYEQAMDDKAQASEGGE